MSTRIALASLVVIGCVGPGGADDDDVPVPDPVPDPAAFTRVEAKVGGEALAAGLEDAATAYGPVTLGATVAANCVTSSGDATDADQDSIPVSATLTYDCNAKRLGYAGTLTGTQSVADDQPSTLAWAFTADTALHASLTGPFGGTMVVDSGGAIVASQRGVTGPFDLARTLDVTTVITNVRGIRTEITEAVDWIVSYTPNLSWSPGGVVVTGQLVADGGWNLAVGNHSAEATLSTPTPLRITPNCESGITAGLVRATFAAGGGEASITVEWTGCGQNTVSYEPSL